MSGEFSKPQLISNRKVDVMSEEPKYTAGFAASEDISFMEISDAIDKTNTEDFVGEDYFKGFKAGLIFAFIDKSIETHGLSLNAFILNSAANYFKMKSSHCASAANLSMLGIREKLDEAFASKDFDQISAVATEALNDILSPLKGDGDER